MWLRRSRDSGGARSEPRSGADASLPLPPPRVAEWYRTPTWGEAEGAAFEARLARTRPSGRPQYLHIQAMTLLGSARPDDRQAAVGMLRRLIAQYPDDLHGRSAWADLSWALRDDGDITGAIDAARTAVMIMDTGWAAVVQSNQHLMLAQMLWQHGGSVALAEAAALLPTIARGAGSTSFVRSTRYEYLLLAARVLDALGDADAGPHARAALIVSSQTRPVVPRLPRFGVPTPTDPEVGELEVIAARRPESASGLRVTRAGGIQRAEDLPDDGVEVLAPHRSAAPQMPARLERSVDDARREILDGIDEQPYGARLELLELAEAAEGLRVKVHDPPRLQEALFALVSRAAAARHKWNDASHVIAAMTAAGFDMRDTVNLRPVADTLDERALPVLLDWLPRVTNDWVKSSIVGMLGDTWARTEAVAPLIAEFHRAPSNKGAAFSGIRWTIARAVLNHADDRWFDEIAALARDRADGSSRSVAIEALAKMPAHRTQVVAMLREFLAEEEPTTYLAAGGVLSRWRDPGAEPRLRSLLERAEERLSAKPRLSPDDDSSVRWERAQLKKYLKRYA
jgi:hypothetical protein